MNLSQFKPFKYCSFYNDSIYNQTFENVTPIVKQDPTVFQFTVTNCGVQTVAPCQGMTAFC